MVVKASLGGAKKQWNAKALYKFGIFKMIQTELCLQ
jgi:hypothetical protein